MAAFDGISNTRPPSLLITIDVEDNPTTVRMLNYSILLKGAINRNVLHQKMEIVIIRSLKNFLSSKVI